MTGLKICERESIVEESHEVVEKVVLDDKFRVVKPHGEEPLVETECYDVPDYCDKYPTDSHCIMAEEEEGSKCFETVVGKCLIYPVSNGWIIKVVYSESEDSHYIEVGRVKDGELEDVEFIGYISDIKSDGIETLKKLPRALQKIIKSIAAEYQW